MDTINLLSNFYKGSQDKILHGSSSKLLYHLLSHMRLVKRNLVPSISNKQEVQVISLGEVANNLTTVVVVHLSVSTATTCKKSNLMLHLIWLLPEFIRSRPVKVRDHVEDPRVIADNVEVSIIDDGLVVFKSSIKTFFSELYTLLLSANSSQRVWRRNWRRGLRHIWRQ